MSISISTYINKDGRYLYLEDFEGRKFKISLPHFAYRECIGVSCGYFILFGGKTRDFWLVNPITRHGLHFPDVPFEVFRGYAVVRVILVHSPPISGWVFLVLNKKTNEIWFSIASKRVWTLVSASFLIHDLYAFKGKIYVLNSAYGLYEMLLYPNPNLTLLKTKDFPELDDSSLLEFANSPENLYVINRNSQHPYKIHELDFGKMKWASLEKRTEEYALFLGNWKHHAVAIPESWVGISSQYRRLKYVRTNKGGKSKLYYASMWYFFHDFLDANLIHE
ncbi:unnamed protein product [Lactuca virosa]|uniref:KIB1-4 beta-propeller domain-containing protein n=1 Tax=Lactuca virosa TaxID=75947 RepID=A0AAU9PIG7_9ASTR|nr:unnamed protein product [Lactuca virosa]